MESFMHYVHALVLFNTLFLCTKFYQNLFAQQKLHLLLHLLLFLLNFDYFNLHSMTPRINDIKTVKKIYEKLLFNPLYYHTTGSIIVKLYLNINFKFQFFYHINLCINPCINLCLWTSNSRLLIDLKFT